MSSQIIVHGYIEISDGSREENAARIKAFCERDGAGGVGLASVAGSAVETWPASIVPVAMVLNNDAVSLCDSVQAEFEGVLKSMEFVSAHLSIRDEEGLGERHLDYAYGPTRFDGPDVISRLAFRRHARSPEELAE